MEYYSELRLRGDDYNDNFGNGMTLTGGSSVKGMSVAEQNDDETVFLTAKGHTLRCIHRRRGNVTDCRTVFENTTDEPAVLELISSFAVRGLNADRMHRATSFWSSEGKLLSQDLTELNMERSWASHGLRVEKFGQVGSMPVRKYFPFLVMEDSERKRFTGVQLYCASSWQIEVLRRDDTVSVCGGIADRDFGQWFKTVRPGESFETPKAVVAEGGSLEEVCDRLVKAQTPRIAEADRDMPVIFNEYCTTWGNPSYRNLERIAEKLDGSGVRYLVIDCGWYKQSDDEEWFGTAGDWEPGRELFPGGDIGRAADMIRSHGLIPGIWFEFENVGTHSAAFEKTELLHKRDGFPVTVGSRRFRDMRDPRVWDELDDKVLKLLKDNRFGYLKVDYNENIGAGVDGDESPGEGLRQSVLESRRYFRHLSEEMPALVIENCSSGGHRLEPSMMELVSQASFSDAHECLSIPLIAAALHRLIRPEQSQIWAVVRSGDDIHRLNYTITSAFLGRLCYSGDIFSLSDAQWQTVLGGIRFYERIKHIIRDGMTDTIETNVRDRSRPAGYQAVRRVLRDEALLIVHTFEKGADPPISRFFEGAEILAEFGSEPDRDFRGKAYLLRYR